MEYLSFLEIIKLGETHNTLALKKYDKKYNWNYACENGDFHLIKYLHLNKIKGCAKSAMNYASATGYLEIVKFLHYNRPEGCTTDAIDKASTNGHLEIVKFLKSKQL